MSEKRIKVVMTPAGKAWSADKEYKLLDYISDGLRMWLSVKVDPETGVNKGHALTDAAWWSACVDMSEALTVAEEARTKATEAASAANTAAASANAAADTANGAAASAKSTAETAAAAAAATADSAANAAKKTAEDAAAKADKATSAANAAADKATAAAGSVDESKQAAADAATAATNAAQDVRALMAAFGAQNPFVGFARVSGDADPTPSDTFVYGSKALVREIGRHMKLGTVKRVDGEAVLQHECAPGRITLATNGDEVKVDGSEGDLLVYTDVPLYLLKANETVNGSEMSCMGVGITPSFWQDHAAKKLEPFAFSPFYTVQAKIFDDERTQAHCVINDKVKGQYLAANGFMKEVFKPDGGGSYSQYVSSIQSRRNAQAKNADPDTNYPYMGLYYEFYELWLAMMYTECGTLDTTNLYCMGVGCTAQDIVTAATWNNEQIAANSGVKMIAADGTVAGYAGVMSPSMKSGTDGVVQNNAIAMFGKDYYGMAKCGEVLSVLDGIVKAGLQEKTGSKDSVFYVGEDGGMKVSEDGSVDIDTGEGMVAAKRYYVVRDVPGCEGIGAGVMTAVVNCYVCMNVADGIYTGNTDLTGGRVLWKFSHACYRGMSIPMDGCFWLLGGFYLTNGKTEDGATYQEYRYALKWQDMVAQTDGKVYGYKADMENSDLLRGLTGRVSSIIDSRWSKIADYSQSLFCFRGYGGGSHTHECAFIVNTGRTSGAGVDDGQMEPGKVGVTGLAVGCRANDAYASARTAYCYFAASVGHGSFAGAFAVPRLKLER